MTTTILECARCGGSHWGIIMKELSKPILYGCLPIATHFAICPKTEEPIIILIKEKVNF